jgi:hypothetical protein
MFVRRAARHGLGEAPAFAGTDFIIARDGRIKVTILGRYGTKAKDVLPKSRRAEVQREARRIVKTIDLCDQKTAP